MINHFQESEIPYGTLERFGLTQEMIEDLPVDVLQNICNGRRSPVLPITVTTEDGETEKARTRFSLVRTPEGGVDVLFYPKLDEYDLNHFNEEMGWVEKFVERMLDLGGNVKFDGAKARDLICDPVEYIKADLEIQKAGVDLLYKCCETLINDPTTYDIMKAYLADEEEDLYWSEGTLEMIEKIGKQNWLFTQL